MVLRLIRALPGDRALLPPSLSRNCVPRKLSASVGAPGPHDFAVRSSALVSRHQSVHRIPHPTSVTIAIRPSCRGGTVRTLRLIWVSEKAKYFLRGGWTGESKNSPSGKSVALAAVLRASPNLILRIFHRHCEEPSCPPKPAFGRRRMRRSNPSRGVRGFGLLRPSDGALRRADGSQ
jgi:hypothetical protein